MNFGSLLRLSLSAALTLNTAFSVGLGMDMGQTVDQDDPHACCKVGADTAPSSPDEPVEFGCCFDLSVISANAVGLPQGSGYGALIGGVDFSAKTQSIRVPNGSRAPPKSAPPAFRSSPRSPPLA